MVEVVQSNDLFLQEENGPVLELNKEDYDFRINLLVQRIQQKKLTHMILYGDREHFSNVEYFTHYDCRFEETLFIVDASGHKSIIVGNEGMGYSNVIPIEVDRYIYQNFSLQGQPRDRLCSLTDILKKIGITQHSKLGIVGTKYFDEDSFVPDPEQTYDVPAYILEAIKAACPHIINAARELTGVPDGIRMRLYTAKEIAWAESAGNRAAAVIQRLLKKIRPGVCEYEAGTLGGAGFDPQNTYPLVNFGSQSVKIGMRSPGNTILQTGMPGGFCYSVRGSLISRMSVFAYTLDDYPEDLRGYFNSFYKPYYAALTKWYESIAVGVTGGYLHQVVMELIGGDNFGVTLNVGHCGGTEEWTNSLSWEGSEVQVPDGALMQADIIAHGDAPVRTAICEDSLVVAGESLRNNLKKEYPDVWKRIILRRKAMKETLGMHLHDDVLPMSNLNGVYYPFLLRTDLVFGNRN